MSAPYLDAQLAEGLYRALRREPTLAELALARFGWYSHIRREAAKNRPHKDLATFKLAAPAIRARLERK